jgi:phenylalanyl-tRNA synthetase beta chain
MIVSLDWLREYVSTNPSADELAERFTMAGLNLESVTACGSDTAIDLEVTSNRPDCLGHLGIAREASVLTGTPLRVPDPQPPAQGRPVSEAAALAIDASEMCPAYIARVIEGVNVRPSPDWLRRRLECVGITPINNIVDVTNYVLMECGQPLHAFDLDKLKGRQIVVRPGRTGEAITGIDHREYRLTPDMCAIADAERAVAIGGIMGGAATEITTPTRNVLIEVAQFRPLTIHRSARALRLHSPSSYRFERRVNEQWLDWASRRCCELILQTGGGSLCSGSLVAGSIPDWKPAPILLRFAQIRRILGIEIAPARCVEILERLGLQAVDVPATDAGVFVPPSWRRDLTREADLIEEIARIHGYEQIPEDRPIPIVAAPRSPAERVDSRIRLTLVAAGFCEAVTFSFVRPETYGLLTPPVTGETLRIAPAAGDYGDMLRNSLIPSLLECRGENARRGNLDAELFELARVYLSSDPDRKDGQPRRIGLVCGRSFAELRGVVDAVAQAVRPSARVETASLDVSQVLPGRGAVLSLDGALWGWMGEIDRDADGVKALKLRDSAAVAELDIQTLVDGADLVPQARPIGGYQAVQRDLNFVLDESVTWRQLEGTIREHAGQSLENVRFVEQYRGQHISAGRKSYVVTLVFRAPDRTLTGDEVDAAVQRVVAGCGVTIGATLR